MSLTLMCLIYLHTLLFPPRHPSLPPCFLLPSAFLPIPSFLLLFNCMGRINNYHPCGLEQLSCPIDNNSITAPSCALPSMYA